MDTSIHFAVLANLVWIRIAGKGSHENSVHLRNFARRELHAGYRQFVLDLERCSGMDSTFMGTLLAISQDVKKTDADQGVFDVVNANQRNMKLLKNLGLDLVLSVDEEGLRWEKQRLQVDDSLEVANVEGAADKATTASVMLEAHEALAKAQPENKARFQDVIECLKHDLQAK